ncbi:MAG TPA: EAL domain-containing protein [Gemmatimonadales bacterium]
MRRKRERALLGISLAAFAGVAVLFGTLIWYLWRESVSAEERFVGGLAASLGERAEAMILDTRSLLQEFDRLPQARCSTDHLQVLQDAAMSRPHLRAIGYWRAAERQCGVGFLQAQALRPPRADRIYDSGVIAWWPSVHTQMGGVRLFLMRFGDHDAAIDPRGLLDIGPLQHRQAGLWVEGLLLTSEPADADLPAPSSLPVGLTIDRGRGLAMSRFSRPGELPIEIVAIEPLDSFLGRYAPMLAFGSAVGLLLLGAFVYALVRYTRYRMSMGMLLRRALVRRRITALYQPVVDLKTRRCVGAEALARWTLDGGEAIAPETFIALAEREGLITDVTLSMLAAPLRDLRAILHASPGLSININLSPEDLKSDRFADAIEAGLRESGLSTGAIKLEITERALINTDAARAMIRRLRERGHEVAVDDFGTGFSSLSYLSTFELDWLKIDKSFVDAIDTGAATSHVIVHVIEMARSLGLRTVAEGVESEKQVRWLIEHGVDCGQGFLFSVPVTAAAFMDYVRLREVA